MHKNRTGMRLCAALSFVALLAATGSAWAHVSVSSPDAEAGGFGKLVFRVPTESDTASTNSLSVNLPEDTPFAFVSAKAKPGWKVDVTKIKHDTPIKVGDFEVSETVSRVTWTATDGGIAPGQFDEFALSVGPFPDQSSTPLVFEAVQGYDDGTTVTWGDVGEDAEHPAPTLTLSAADVESSAEALSTAEAESTSGAQTEVVEATDGGDLLARIIGVAALVVAGGALLIGRRKNGIDA